MATKRQIAANQRNAARSTGPRSSEGKAKSRLNAIRHGLAGDGEAVAGQIEADATFGERLDEWTAGTDGGPESAERRWAFRRMVRASLRIERSERHFELVVVDEARQARVAWDHDRTIEATRLAARLATEPEVVKLELETTRQGCEVMRDRWRRLGDVLDAQGAWDDDERGHALDLLGVPLAFRRGPTPIDAAGEDAREELLDLVRSEIDRLEGRAAGPLDDLDRARQGEACRGLWAESTPAGKLALRYEREAWWRYNKARRDLARLAADESNGDGDRDDPEADHGTGPGPDPAREITAPAGPAPGPVPPEPSNPFGRLRPNLINVPADATRPSAEAGPRPASDGPTNPAAGAVATGRGDDPGREPETKPIARAGP